MPLPPFIIYALPRSRTYWLSRYLSVGGWQCGHDESRHVRAMEDVKSWFSMPRTGTVETAAAPFWRLVQEMRPDIRTVVIRRDPEAVIESLLRTGTVYDLPRLRSTILRLDAKLSQIEARVPDTWSIRFEDLAQEDVCAELTEELLGVPHSPQRWALFDATNLQIDFPALVSYCAAFRTQMERSARMAAQHLRFSLMRRAPASVEFVFRQEPLATVLHDGARLIADHCVMVGEPADSFTGKNLALLQRLEDIDALHITTARQNGRLFGYLVSITAPSLESESRTEAMHTTFFTSPLAPGLGLKLQRASIQFLRQRGIDQVFMRAGVRGSGPRMGKLYQRLGAQSFGEMFNLPLQEIA